MNKISKKLYQKLDSAEKTRHRLARYYEDLTKDIRKYYNYPSEDEIYVTEVGGDGIVVNYNNGLFVTPIDKIILIIEKKGFFDEKDLDDNGI